MKTADHLPKGRARLRGMGIRCPACGGRCRTVDSRPRKNGRARRYQCRECGHRFSTIEFVAEAAFVGGHKYD